MLGLGFRSPELLFALVLVPLAALAYVLAQRHRAGSTTAFADAALLASAVPSGPGWRRHVSVALALVALAVMLVALARPERTVAVPDERAAIVLATDRSGSMQATDVKPTRLSAARAAARRFLDDVPRGVRVGIVAFNQIARVVQTPTARRADAREALAGLRPSGGTATGEAIAASLRVLRPRNTAPGNRNAPGAIVLLSDGTSTRGRDPVAAARAAGRAGVQVYTVAVGTDRGTIQVPQGGGFRTQRVPPDSSELRAIARASGGRAFTAADAGELGIVYETLGSQLGTKEEAREVSSSVAGGALLVLLLSGGLSLRWFARPL